MEMMMNAACLPHGERGLPLGRAAHHGPHLWPGAWVSEVGLLCLGPLATGWREELDLGRNQSDLPRPWASAMPSVPSCPSGTGRSTAGEAGAPGPPWAGAPGPSWEETLAQEPLRG